MVPPTWNHPKKTDGTYIPLYDGSYTERAAEWDEEYAQWQLGFRRNYAAEKWVPKEGAEIGMDFSEWNGRRPSPTDYMPEWTEAEKTHLMMYETTSDGTPLSPPFEKAEDLARWLADTGASAFGSMTATYEQWLCMVGRRWAPSAIAIGGHLMSGVEATAAQGIVTAAESGSHSDATEPVDSPVAAGDVPKPH